MSAGFGAPWSTVFTVVAVTAAIYASVVIVVRLAGRRTLAELSAFDVVVTIALGTILGSTAVSRSVTFVEGVVAVVTLLAMQVLVAAARRVSPRVRHMLDFRPIELIRNGKLSLDGGVFGPQLTEDEVTSQFRLRGAFDPRDVDRAVLEPTSGISVSQHSRPRRGGTQRSTRDVVEAHLALRREGDLERDLLENYSDDVVLLSAEGVHHGHEGVRKLARVLRSYVPDGSYAYERVLVEGNVGMLRWSARRADVDVHDGADTYVVDAGLIVAQTIHYSTRSA